MTRYLFLASSGKLNDGGLVLNRQLSEALARGHDVHMITIGPCEQQREGVTVVELDEALLSPQATADVQQTRHFVDRFSKIIRASLDEQGPERVGLPTDPGAFDVIVGYGDVTGPAALHLRDVYYPDAKVSTVITMDPKALFKALDLPELGEHRIGNHREVLARSDLILAHGPKSAVDARQLATEWSQARSLPPTHEFVPGVETAREDPVPWQPGEPFNVLMLGRMHDKNKGAADVALAVADMREDGYEDMHLTLRGVDPKDSGPLLELLDRQLGKDRWRSFVTVEEFTDDRAVIERSIQESHVMVMATESEAYGLAASEYAAHGKPLIVAKGYGNGFATLLQDESRIPRDIADRFVLDDSGSRSANNSLIGESNTVTPTPRYTLIADRLTDVHDNYEVYAQTALRLRDHLGEYTHEHAASGIGQAVDNVLAGDIRHTKQIAQGVNIAPSQEELLQGIPSDKHGLILQPREMSPRRPLREAEVLQGDAETNGPLAAASTGDERQDAALSEARPPSSGGAAASGPDHELAERVRLNELSLERGRREASPFEMLRSGMSQEETMAAISSWEALGRPETAQERQARLEEGRAAAPEAGAESSLETPDRASRAAEAPEPTTTAEPAAKGPRPAPAPGPGREESRSAPDGPGKTTGPTEPTSTAGPAEPHHSTAARTPERTSSAVWETPEPRIESMARHRTQWALYDDLHGYGRRPPLVPVRTPDRGPGAYQDLLHPSTGAAYERDRHQVESGDRGYSR